MSHSAKVDMSSVFLLICFLRLYCYNNLNDPDYCLACRNTPFFANTHIYYIARHKRGWDASQPFSIPVVPFPSQLLLRELQRLDTSQRGNVIVPERVLSPLCPICSKAADQNGVSLREMKGEAIKTQFYTASDEIKSNEFVVKRSNPQRRDPWQVWIPIVEPKGTLWFTWGKNGTPYHIFAYLPSSSSV